MKRFLAAILSLTMVLLSFTSVFAETETEITEDITSNPITFLTNTNTVSTKASDGFYADPNSTNEYITMQKGHSFRYTVNTQKAGKYLISVDSGGYREGVQLNVVINDSLQLEGIFTVINNSYFGATQNLGVITLSEGANVFCFNVPTDKSSAAVIMKSFTLTEYKEDLETLPATFLTNKDTVKNLTGVDAGNSAAGDNGYITMQASGHSFSYTVTTHKPGKYNVSVYCGSYKGNEKLNVYINNNKQIEGVLPVYTGNHFTRVAQDLGTVTLSEGENSFRFEVPNNSPGAIIMQSFTLSEYVLPTGDVSGTYATTLNTVSGGAYDKGNSSETFVTLQKNQSFEYTMNINSAEAGKYNISVKSGGKAEGVKVKVSVNGTLQTEAEYSDIQYDWYAWADQPLGTITLTEGTNVLKFECPSDSASAVIIQSFTLEKYINDLETLPAVFNTNTTTVEDYSNAQTDLCSEDYLTLSKGKYFEYTVTAQEEKQYKLSVNSGASKSGVQLDVYVGDVKKIAGTFTNITGAYQNWGDQELGILTIKKGKNVIKFSMPSSSADAAVIKSFKLSEYVIPTASLSADASTRIEAENYASENVVSHTGASGGKWISNLWADGADPIYIKINAAQEGYFDLDYAMLQGVKSGDLSCVTIYLDEEEIGDNTGTAVKNMDTELGFSWQYGSMNLYRTNAVHITEGEHIIKITVGIASGDKYKYQIDYLEFTPCTGLKIMGFNAVTKEGGRVPYTIRDGLEVYGEATVLKTSANDSENYTVIIAQYAPDGALVQAAAQKLDISDMAANEIKTFSVPMKYKGDGGTVKAFLWDTEKILPINSAKTYTERNFFANDTEVLNEDTKYVQANTVTDANGNYYDDYSIHDDNYDIDAIFYDSVVGSQSKVFAYIGVPKGASEKNPVPAVVCVHGGAGVAYSEWVKIWNDKGYAAIAMTLTGDQPGADTLDSAPYDKYPHPYKGLACWGSQAFKADYKNASMYQNVLNVIRAHNVLRSYPGVDEDKIGITGISWGGVTTTTVIGVDQRFKFAAPVYGAGYLDECASSFGDFFKVSGNTAEWDPANFSARSSVPVLFVNSDSDAYFTIDCTTKTNGVTPNSKICIKHDYFHNYTNGWGVPEIYAFADAMLKGDGENPFITVTDQQFEDGVMTVEFECPSGVSAQSADIYYMTKTEMPYGGGVDKIGWKKISDYEMTGDTLTVTVPADATYCYATIADNNGNLISSKLVTTK